MHKYAAATALAIALNMTMLDAETVSAGSGAIPIPVRAGTPRVILPLYAWRGHPTEITELPHNGTALLRGDGSIYYSPKPGFTGRDGVRVRLTDCDLRNPYCSIGVVYAIFVE
jgi:hypothetical protein